MEGETARSAVMLGLQLLTLKLFMELPIPLLIGVVVMAPKLLLMQFAMIALNLMWLAATPVEKRRETGGRAS